MKLQEIAEDATLVCSRLAHLRSGATGAQNISDIELAQDAAWRVKVFVDGLVKSTKGEFRVKTESAGKT